MPTDQPIQQPLAAAPGGAPALVSEPEPVSGSAPVGVAPAGGAPGPFGVAPAGGAPSPVGDPAPQHAAGSHPIRLDAGSVRRSGIGWAAGLSWTAAAVLVVALVLVGTSLITARRGARPALGSAGAGRAGAAVAAGTPPAPQADDAGTTTVPAGSAGSDPGAELSAISVPPTTVPAASAQAGASTGRTGTSAGRVTARQVTKTVHHAGLSPLGTAQVEVSCGDTRATRRIEGWSVGTNQLGNLFVGASNPGGGLIQDLKVGDQYPADKELIWSVIGVLQGPWPVNRIVDHCTDVTTVVVADQPAPANPVSSAVPIPITTAPYPPTSPTMPYLPATPTTGTSVPTTPTVPRLPAGS